MLKELCSGSSAVRAQESFERTRCLRSVVQIHSGAYFNEPFDKRTTPNVVNSDVRGFFKILEGAVRWWASGLEIRGIAEMW